MNLVEEQGKKFGQNSTDDLPRMDSHFAQKSDNSLFDLYLQIGGFPDVVNSYFKYFSTTNSHQV
jgi:hypothetical protein